MNLGDYPSDDKKPQIIGGGSNDEPDNNGAQKKVVSILDGEKGVSNFNTKYLTQTAGVNESLYIDLSTIPDDLDTFQLELSVYLDTLYRESRYMEGLDRKNLEFLLYSTKEEISTYKITNNIIRICTCIKELNEQEDIVSDLIYRGDIRKNKENMVAVFYPNDLTDAKVYLGERYANNEFFTMKSGIFHAKLWKLGVKYYGTSTFLEDVDNQSRGKLNTILEKTNGVVALGKKVKPAIDDKFINHEILKDNPTIAIPKELSKLPPLKLRKQVIVKEGKTLNEGLPVCIFPQVTEEQVICVILKGQEGTHGRDIGGNIVHTEDNQEIDVRDIFSAGHEEYIDIDNSKPGFTMFRAKKNAFVVEVDKKIGFAEHRKYVGNIDKYFGSLVLPEGCLFELNGNVDQGYSIKGYDIIYNGELRGEIQAKNRVEIRGGGVIGGTIISENGDIVIDSGVRIQDGSKIESLDGKIIIHGDVTGATIVGKNIIVMGTTRNCILFGGQIQLNKNNKSNVFAEAITVKADMTSGSEYCIIIYGDIHRLMRSSNNSTTTDGIGTKIGDNSTTGFAREDILLSNEIHPESRTRIIVFAYDMLKRIPGSNKDEAQKIRDGVNQLIKEGLNYSGVPFDHTQLPLTRWKATELLGESLQHLGTRVCRTEERIQLYTKGIKIKASLEDHENGYFYDFSNSGGSFIFEGYEGEPYEPGVIVLIKLGTKCISLLVYRSELKEVKDKKILFIGGKYTDVEVGNQVNQILLAKRAKIN